MLALVYKCFVCNNQWEKPGGKVSLDAEECQMCKAMIPPFHWFPIDEQGKRIKKEKKK